MKRKSLLLSLAAAALAVGMFFVFDACTNEEDSAQSIRFTNITLDRSYRLLGSNVDFESDSDLVFSCRFAMLFPEQVYDHDINALKDSILVRTLDSVSTDRYALVEAAFRGAAAEIGYPIADTVARFETSDGYFLAEGAVTTLSSSILSYAVKVSEMQPGAAHGFYTTSYINYDLVGARIFTLDQIIDPAHTADVLKIIRRTARQMRAYVGITSIDSYPSGGNFYVSLSNDILFAYQPYEIASYAQGEIEIPVAAYDLADYLTPYGRHLLLNE